MTGPEIENGSWAQRRQDAAVLPALEVDGAQSRKAASDGVCAVALDAFGELTPISRLGGQGRVHRPALIPPLLGRGPVVIKLYRRSPPPEAAQVLSEMVAWNSALPAEQRVRLGHLAAWPVAVVSAGRMPRGIAMQDVSGRFAVPFVMPSGRRERVLLSLEHLLGADAYLQARGLNVRLDTVTRAQVAERISGALAFLHRHAIVASDIAPSNLLVSFGTAGTEVCFIDCDSMVFRGRQALASVETGDWDVPTGFAEPGGTRATDAYKLGLVVLRLFARCHDARVLRPHLEHVPEQLRPLLFRALGPDTANRPPAGEWQRALREELIGSRLNERYPGPAPAPASFSPTQVAVGQTLRARGPEYAAPAVHSYNRRSYNRRSYNRGATAPASYGSRGSGQRTSLLAGNDWLRRAVVVSWVVAGTLVLFLILSRLFAATVPTPDIGVPASRLPGATVGGGPYSYRYYYPPGGGGQGIPQGARVVP